MIHFKWSPKQKCKVKEINKGAITEEVTAVIINDTEIATIEMMIEEEEGIIIEIEEDNVIEVAAEVMEVISRDLKKFQMLLKVRHQICCRTIFASKYFQIQD